MEAANKGGLLGTVAHRTSRTTGLASRRGAARRGAARRDTAQRPPAAVAVRPVPRPLLIRSGAA